MRSRVTTYGGYILAGVILIFLLQLCNVKNGVITTLENQAAEKPKTDTIIRIDTIKTVSETTHYIKVFKNVPADTVTLVQLIADTNLIVSVDSIENSDLKLKYTIYSYCPVSGFGMDYNVKCPPQIEKTIEITKTIPDNQYHFWGGIITDQAKFYGLTVSISKGRLNIGAGYLFNNKFIGTVQYKIK